MQQYILYWTKEIADNSYKLDYICINTDNFMVTNCIKILLVEIHTATIITVK